MTVAVRTCIVLILASAIGVPAFAQSKVSGGVKAGVNFASVSGDIGSDVSKKIRTGGAFGGFLSIDLTDNISFDPEVLYSMEGVKVEFDDSGTTYTSTAKVDVVEIPLLFRFGMRPSGRTAGYFLVGPSIGFIASAKQEDPFGGSDEDFKDELKSTSTSLVVGAGVTVSQFLVEARYMAGLTDVNNDNSEGDANKLRVFSILFGVRF